MNPLDYYATLTALAFDWGRVNVVHLYDFELPPVGFGYETFLAKVIEMQNDELIGQL